MTQLDTEYNVHKKELGLPLEQGYLVGLIETLMTDCTNQHKSSIGD